MEINFLSIEDLFYFHQQEMIQANTTGELRDISMLESCVGTPQATFGGSYLMNIFEMATSYIISICIHHPFTDGNKRVALLAGVVFLELNGYDLQEEYEEEFANIIIEFLTDSKEKEFIIDYIESHSIKMNIDS